MKKELVILPFWLYNESAMHVTKDIADGDGAICYVTLNKTYRSLLNRFVKEDIDGDRFYFVDAITPSLLKFDSHDRCAFLDSLNDLDEFAEALLSVVKKHKVKHVLFDSISSFLVYSNDQDVLKFFNYVVSFLEELDTDLTLLVLKEDAKRPAVKQIEMLVDESKKA